MKLDEFKAHLARHPGLPVRFVLPDGVPVPAHAHVTEVARIEKHFIDCGGTRRADAYCRLQTWVADDLDHRLTSDKLLGILTKAAPLLQTEDLEVDVEHELEFITQFPLASLVPVEGEIQVRLTRRHTDCLAKELCTPPLSAAQPIAFGKAFAKSRPQPTFNQP